MNIKGLLQQSVQKFIIEHQHADARTLALQQKVIDGVSSSELASQIIGRQKAQQKFPLFFNTPNIIYPPSLNLEQSSSQATAIFKSEIVKKYFQKNPTLVVDLTGGLGIDSFFLSKCSDKLYYVEPNDELQKIVEHNHAQLGSTNIYYHNQNAETFLHENTERVSLFYLDPSRRVATQKVYALNDCEPNVLELLIEIFKQSAALLLKAAPMLDISKAVEMLRCVNKVFIVSVENEVKELLFWCEPMVNGNYVLEAVNLNADGDILSSFNFNREEEQKSIVSYSEPLKFLYEPNAAILKAGAFKIICERFNLSKLAPSTHLYTSEQFVKDFPGRVFEINSLVKADSKVIQKFVPDGKINVITRNYPLSAEALKTKLKIQDGGDLYLLAFASQKNKLLAVCNRLI